MLKGLFFIEHSYSAITEKKSVLILFIFQFLKIDSKHLNRLLLNKLFILNFNMIFVYNNFEF